MCILSSVDRLRSANGVQEIGGPEGIRTLDIPRNYSFATTDAGIFEFYPKITAILYPRHSTAELQAHGQYATTRPQGTAQS